MAESGVIHESCSKIAKVAPLSLTFLKVKKLSSNAILPSRGSPLSAGYDLSSAAEVKVPARGKALIPTDLSIAIPENTYARIAPRSGLTWKHSIDVGAGVIDADYRGSVGVILFNHSELDFMVKPGDRVAQLIIQEIITPDVVETEDLGSSIRGAGGFGSTGLLQLKNKWDQLKKDCKIWKDLKRGFTGLGWDLVERTIATPEEWCAERLAVVPAAKKFKLSGIEPEFEEKLDHMFEVVLATGNFACSPSETGFASNAVNLETPGDSVDFIDIPSPDQNEYETTSCSNSRVDKRTSDVCFLRKELSEAVSCYKAKCQTSHSSTIEEALEILSVTVEIYADEDLYLLAIELIEDPVRRDIFVKMPTARRVAYIRRFNNHLNI